MSFDKSKFGVTIKVKTDGEKPSELIPLLDCPFCGKIPIKFDENKYYVEHRKKCFMLSLYMTKIEKVWIDDIDKWNTRAI